MINQLQHLGLSDKEASVYMASLELGSDTVQEIAKRAEVKRANTYAVIEKLMSKDSPLSKNLTKINEVFTKFKEISSTNSGVIVTMDDIREILLDS